MTVAEIPETADLVEPRPRKWTREEYYQMADLGLFEDQRVELIDGEIYQMAPQKSVHGAIISLAQKAVVRACGEGYWVRTQLPLFFDALSEPEPDVAVVTGSERDYIVGDHPRTAVLVIEVSETTLRYDRTRKASLYAAAAIEDYWIINLVDRQVEMHRNRVADASQKFGWRFRDVAILKPGEAISPLARPDAKIAVNDILP